MMIEFVIAKCKTKATYSAKPKQNGKVNLKRIKQHFEIVLSTPILVVIKSEAGEVIVHQHGELLFKKCKDYPKMEKVAKEIYQHFNQN